MEDARIISVHIPKTAGTSFLKALEDGLGTEHVRQDFGNRVGRLNVETLISEAETFNAKLQNNYVDGIQCIHGHFPPQKYRCLIEQGWMAITWLREPAAQLYSNFHHILRTANTFEYLPDTIGYCTINEGLNFRNFALHPMTRNFMQRFFCRDLQYSFVGITERYRTDLEYFSNKFLGFSLPFSVQNSFSDPSAAPAIEPDLIKEIERVHKRDYEMYRHYLTISLGR